MSDITITIKSSGDAKHEISIALTATVLELKEQIAAQADVPADRQRLIYSGKVLKDDQTLELYKVKTGHTIHLVKSAGTKAAPAATSSSAGAPATESTPTSTGVPANIAAGQGSFNPLADLTGARYAGYTQLPSALMFGPDGGMNASMPDPEQLQQMMLNPMFQESMNSMLSNPQMLDYLIQQLPQLRALGPQAREMLQSPFFRQMISNPEMMRSMMSMGAGLGAGGNTAFPAPGANPNVGGDAATDAAASGSTGSTGSSGATGGAGAGAANPFASMFPGGMPPMDFGSLFGGANAAPADTRPPEERFQSQLALLNDMGFFDFDRNVRALTRSGGNVQGAVEYLLSDI